MAKYINLANADCLKYNKEIKNYLAPNYIYVPYYDGDEVDVKASRGIKLGKPLIKRNDSYVFSSVSGKAIGMTNMLVDNKINKTIVLENDFMEKNSFFKLNKNTQSLTKDELIDKLKKFDALYDNFEGDYLIVSGLDVEPFESNIKYIVNKYADDILECTSLLINILNIKKCIIVINSADSENALNLVNQIGTYPDIHLKLLPNLYPLGRKEILVNEVVPNKNAIVLNAEEIINIYDIIKKDKPVINKYVSFSGNLLNKSKVVKCKIGTSLSEIIDDEFKIKDDNYHVVINGLLSGYEIDTLNTVITKNVRSVFITKSIKCNQEDCINCGMCVSFCPVGANRITNYKMEKCIKCGICSYVCPANIKVGGNR